MDIKNFGSNQLKGSFFTKEDLANILIYYSNAGSINIFGSGANMFVAVFDDGKMKERFNMPSEFYNMVEKREKDFQELLNRIR